MGSIPKHFLVNIFINKEVSSVAMVQHNFFVNLRRPLALFHHVCPRHLIIKSSNIKVINSLAKSQLLPRGRLKREGGTSMKPCIFAHYRPPQVLARGLWRGWWWVGGLEGGGRRGGSKLTIKVMLRTGVRCREMGKEMHTYQCHISSLQFPACAVQNN